MARTKAFFPVAATCGLFLAVASVAIAGPASGRKPVPNDADVAKSRQLVRSAFEEEYREAGSSGEPTSLINALLGAADKGTEATQQYALLLEAEQLAVQHDDAVAALAIIDRRERMFDIDGLQEKARTLTELAGPKVSGDTDLLTQSMQTAMKAASAERFDIATEAINLAVSIAKSIDKAQKAEARKQVRRPAAGEKTPALSGPGLIKQAQEAQARINESKKYFAAYEEALAVLQKVPEDAAASTAAATYLCLVKQNWDAGLSHLARSKHTTLRSLAKEEIALPPNAANRFALAGKWWAAAEEKEIVSCGNDAIRLHAARHYHAMLPQLKDPLERRLAEKRCQAFKQGVLSQQPAVAAPAAKDGTASTAVNETQPLEIDLVPVGDPGNPADTNGLGSVAYEFRIGKYEITNEQYCAFLNAVAQSDPYGLYHHQMNKDGTALSIERSGTEGAYKYQVMQRAPEGHPNAGARLSPQRPIACVSWVSAARFCNWLHNGQGDGATENGAYALNGLKDVRVPREENARFFLPTEDEWYKAAFYRGADPTGEGSYWTFAVRSNDKPQQWFSVAIWPYEKAGDWNNFGKAINTQNDAVSMANWSRGGGVSHTLAPVNHFPNTVTDYGCQCMCGNVAEWVDPKGAVSTKEGIARGGFWWQGAAVPDASWREAHSVQTSIPAIGFRIAAIVENSK